MTDESTVLDSQPEDDCVPASIAGIVGTSVRGPTAEQATDGLGQACGAIVDKLRADLKPRKSWRVTKAKLEGRIAELESALERRTTQASDMLKAMAEEHGRADFNRLWALIAWAIVGGLLVRMAWR